jgi:hypothetical protein
VENNEAPVYIENNEYTRGRNKRSRLKDLAQTLDMSGEFKGNETFDSSMF